MLSLLVTLGILGAGSPGADPNGIDFFEKSIRPALVRYCYECHSSATAKPKGRLRLDSRDGVRRGGKHGPAVIPGNVDESLLIVAIRRVHPTLKMPPDRELPAAVVRDFVRWVASGAPDPRDAPPTAAAANALKWEAIYNERRKWWSFQPLADVLPPEVAGRDDSADPIDRFIRVKLEENGLEPAPEAERSTLVRRLSFALTGLPPSESLLEAALADGVSGAWEPAEWGRLVDRVLATPHFGERWARHWMDVVRFSETYGYEWDIWAKGAWRYRDYLIRAFNVDLPFDDFVREHVAGDLLEEPRLNHEDGINESLIGPMFFQMGEKRHDDTLVFNGIHQDMLDDQIDAFSKAFQGLTLSCSRCHDHKLDPFSQREYYALGGVLMSSRWVTNTLDLPERNAAELEVLEAIKAELQPLVAEAWLRDLESFDQDLLAAAKQTKSKPVGGNASPGETATETAAPTRTARLLGLLSAAAKAKTTATGDDDAPSRALEDPLYPWLQLTFRQRAGESVEVIWAALQTNYTQASQRLRADNDDNLQIIADFRDGIPGGWSVDGVGLREIVHCGDFTVDLTGDGTIDRLLEGGLFTNALSPRLNGAVRTPYLRNYDKPRMSFEQVGGNFATHRTVFDNEFLTEHQKRLDPKASGWLSLPTHHTLKERATYIEFATKTSNPNFPPRIGKCRECTREVVADPRSWFGLTRVALHDEAFTPRDDLSRFLSLFDGEAPQTLEDVAARYSEWLAAAVEIWKDGRATVDEVRLINWCLANDLFGHRPRDESGSGEPARRDTEGEALVLDLVDRYRRAEGDVRTPETVNGMIDHDPGYNYPLDISGDYDRPGERVARGFPRLLAGDDASVQAVGSGRRELAELVADPANPLTARVFVNRVWHWLFGAGLVDTPSNFGHLGGLPSHPELLDYLAQRFVREGWSVKSLVRAIVMTRSWRQSGKVNEKAFNVDPNGRLLSFFPMRRLEAESIRDSLLATSGRLEARLYGPSVFAFREVEGERAADCRLYVGPLDGDGRRSIYTRVSIMGPPGLLTTFNQPDPKIPTGRRDVTSTPAQSLTLLNGPLANDQAEYWARSLIAGGHADAAERIEQMFRRAFARRPTAVETARWVAAIDELVADGLLEGSLQTKESRMSSVPLWKAIAHALYNTKEFIYVR